MKFARFLAAPLLFCALAPAHAQQFRATADVDTPDGDSDRYFGSDIDFGDVSDGGRDAFDGYGDLFSTGRFSVSRQTEFFASRNLYRFLDTFTNDTAARITRTVIFFGDLGSDGRTFELLSDDGLLVTCQSDDADGVCTDDPVLAHVYSNKGVGGAGRGGDDDEDSYTAVFRLSLAPGESASLLNFAFLASEAAGTSQRDIDLAIARGRALQANPFAFGLTNEQRARIVNFDVAPGVVPEPATWGLMIAGVGMVGGALRTRRRTATATA